LFLKTKAVAVHPRCWRRRQRIEQPGHVEEARRQRQQITESAEVALFSSLGETFRSYLEGLTHSNQPIAKNLSRLLALKDQYGTGSLSWALVKAMQHGAYGADYIENILYQEMTPVTVHLPVHTKDEAINRIRLSEPSLAEYDAIIVKGVTS
jgi:hypothetical protein